MLSKKQLVGPVGGSTSMILLRKGAAPAEICRECKKIHSAAECPAAEARRAKYPFMTMREFRKLAL